MCYCTTNLIQTFKMFEANKRNTFILRLGTHIAVEPRMTTCGRVSGRCI